MQWQTDVGTKCTKTLWLECNAYHVIFVTSREQHIAGQHFGSNAAKRPHVDGSIELISQQDLWRS